MENPLKVLQESYRVLKDEGILLIVDFTGYGMKWFEKIRLGIRYLKKWGVPPRYTRGNLSPDKLNFLVESSGFATGKFS